jgi:hypothetical protein
LSQQCKNLPKPNAGARSCWLTNQTHTRIPWSLYVWCFGTYCKLHWAKLANVMKSQVQYLLTMPCPHISVITLMKHKLLVHHFCNMMNRHTTFVNYNTTLCWVPCGFNLTNESSGNDFGLHD